MNDITRTSKDLSRRLKEIYDALWINCEPIQQCAERLWALIQELDSSPEPCVPQTAIALLADDAYAATFQTMAQYRAALISSLRTAQLEPYCWAIELDGICTDRLYSEHRDARLIASDYRTDGRTAEVVALVNLDDVRSASATPPACEPRTQLPDEREMRLAQPPASEPPADYIAPIACIRVGEDDTCEVLKLYAPGLPPGEHDLYPAASAPPPRADVDRRVAELYDAALCSITFNLNEPISAKEAQLALEAAKEDQVSDRWQTIRSEALPKAGRFARTHFRTQQTRDAAEAGYMRGYLAGATRDERRGYAKRCACIDGENCSNCSRPTKGEG